MQYTVESLLFWGGGGGGGGLMFVLTNLQVRDNFNEY